MALENQRYGRNKSTLVNKTYIDGGAYRRKFDAISGTPALNKSLYDCAKKALKHRSGTEYEDMYWIDGATGKVILAVTDSTEKRSIAYSDRIKNGLQGKTGIVTIHTHPSSMPPSIADFNSCFANGYEMGVVACHDGTVFKYTSQQLVSDILYNLYIKKFFREGLSEFDAQLKAIETLQRDTMITLEEVLGNE